MLKKMRLQLYLVSFLSVFLWATSSYAVPMVDGVFNVSEYTAVFSEDQDKNQDYLGPGYGGQPYDVEHLGLYLTGDRLYFGLQTGVPLQSGSTYLAYQNPGDIALDIGNNGTWDYGIRFWSEDGFQVIEATSWHAPYYTQHSESTPFRAATGTVIDVDYNIEFGVGVDGFGNATNILEGWISLAALGISGYDQDITANFTMRCGNDYGRVTVSAAPVPEPGTMLLLGAGLVGVAGMARKRFKKKSL